MFFIDWQIKSIIIIVNIKKSIKCHTLKNGGIFFLDEIDNSDPSALIVINSALANGYMAFPHETIDRHKDFRIIAAANTWGKGADLQYVGRNALDGATLDRFDNIFFDYDTKLERALKDYVTYMPTYVYDYGGGMKIKYFTIYVEKLGNGSYTFYFLY